MRWRGYARPPAIAGGIGRRENVKEVCHLAIIKKEKIQKILSEEIKYDYWFGKTKKAPYKDVGQGDEIMLKEPGGKIRGRVIVENALFFDDYKKLNNIETYGILSRIASLAKKEKTKYITILLFSKPDKYLAPVTYKKKDSRRWVVLG